MRLGTSGLETKLTWWTPSELVAPCFSWRLNGLLSSHEYRRQTERGRMIGPTLDRPERPRAVGRYGRRASRPVAGAFVPYRYGWRGYKPIRPGSAQGDYPGRNAGSTYRRSIPRSRE